jgi:REP element-mobilizing transposase RayT
MNSYRQILYHIVFCTYYRRHTIPESHQDSLYKYISGVISKRDSYLYEINGVGNHIHILTDLHPTVALSDFIKEIKTSSNRWMKASGNYQDFTSWAVGSCSLTYAYRDKDMIANYIQNQKEHHKKITFEVEYRSLLEEHGIEADERYIF